METTKLHLLFISLLITLLTLSTAARANITAIFAFGDSILDAGNNNDLPTLYKSNHHPYGLTFPNHIATGRFSDGKLVTDFLVSKLGIKHLLPAYMDQTLTDRDLLTGASFASAGSGLDDLTANNAGVMSMGRQLRYFEEALGRMGRVSGLNETGRVVENGLFMIAVGTNDMLNNFYVLPLRRMFSLSRYQSMLLGNLETVIRRLHSMGARRIAVSGLPPIGCLPLQVTLGSLMPSFHMLQRRCVNRQNLDSQSYNAKLQALTSRLQSTLPGSRVVYVDIYTPMMDMIRRPQAYGFERTLEGCCGIGVLEMGPLCSAFAPTCQNPSKSLFWDAAHPSQGTYSQLATHFYNNVLPTLLA